MKCSEDDEYIPPMLTIDGEYVVCSEPGCPAKVKNHKWGRIKAEGWFFRRDETEAWCPEHLPKWVKRWREHQAAQAADSATAGRADDSAARPARPRS